MRPSPTLLALPFLALYVLAWWWPEPLWAVNDPGFLPGIWPVGLLVTGGLLLVVPGLMGKGNRLPVPVTSTGRWAGGLLLAGGMGLLFWLFPMHTDPYGDAIYIRQLLDGRMEDWKPELIGDLFKLELLNPKIGGNTVSNLAVLVAYLTGTTAAEALLWINGISGVLLVLLWWQLVARLITDPTLRGVAALMLLTSPVLLAFYGHYEFYPPAYLGILAFLGSMTLYFQTGQRGYLWALLPLFVLAIKLHVTSYLLVFPLGLTFASAYSGVVRRNLSWPKIALGLFLPGLVAGLVLYFLVLESHDGPRAYTEQTLEQALLLPLFTNEGPPLDRYNLFSPAHLLDYANLVLLWSPVAVFLLLAMVVGFRRHLRWQEPVVIIIGTTLLIYMAAFFVLNPLLSMPVDRDLFSLPAMSLWVFVLVLLSQLQGLKPGKLLGPVLALSLFGATGVYVHHHPQSLSQKVESMGIWKFKTYWIGASTSLHMAHELESDAAQAQNQRLEVLAELEPYTIKGNDLEYADLLCEAGKHHFQREAYKEAIPYFKKAYAYRPNLSRNVFYLLSTHFMLGQYAEAHRYSRLLIGVRYPNQQKAFRMAIHVAVEAEAYEDALRYCQEYLKIWPEDEFIHQVGDQLQTGEGPSGVKRLFRKN